MKKEKILIIGFGNMGLAHFKSFINRDYIIHIVEKENNEKIKSLKKNKYIKKKFFLFEKIPSKQKYFLVISSTTSKERFPLIKKFFNNNTTKFLLLEKFCFFSINQFSEFEKKFNHKTKAFINSWGYILAKKTVLRGQLRDFKIICNIKEGNLLGNITHLFHFFSYLNKKKQIEHFTHENSSIIKNHSRKYFDELRTKIKIKDIKKNEMVINTKKSMKELMTFNISQSSSKVKFKLSIFHDNSIYFFKNGVKLKKIKFPFSSKTSFQFLKNSKNGYLSFMPSFKDDQKLSKLILTELNVKIP